MGFGGNLRALREARGWSEMDLYRRSGVGQAAISRLETEPNPNPKMQTLVKLARALEVSVDLLIGSDEAPALADRIAAIERRLLALESGPAHPVED